MTTVSQTLLDPLMSRDPVGPRITYYDDTTGERIELSTVTLFNWAAKTANLLRDELGATPDSRIAVLLPAHWQTAAVLLGAWYIGAQVTLGTGDADIALCTADRIDDADAAVGAGEIAVLSLDPFGKPVADLPVGLTDYATAVRVHGDQIVAERQPGPALDGRSATELVAAAADSAAAQGFVADDRVLSTATWNTTDELITNFLAPLAAGASLVLVANPESSAQDRRRQTEKITKG